MSKKMGRFRSGFARSVLGNLSGLSFDDAVEKSRHEEGISWRSESRIKTRTGEERWIANAAVQVPDDHGNIIGSLGILQDITERKLAEKSLEESERLYRSAIEVAGAVPYFQNYLKGIYEFVGPGIEPLTGYSPDEFTYEIWQSLAREIIVLSSDLIALSPDDAVDKAKKGEGVSWRADYRIKTRTGEERWIANAAVQVTDDHGNIIGSLGTLQDITERKQAEAKLRFRAMLLDNIRDCVTATNLEGCITYVNKAECELMGRKPEELIGQSVEVYGEAPEVAATQREIIETTREMGEWYGEIVNFNSKNERLILECRTWLLHDAAGESSGMCGVSRDITERKRMEEELFKARKLESIGILAGGIAHDFNNLLTAILGNVSLAKVFADPHDKIFERLTDAEKASLSAQALTQQLLTFSKGGAPIKETADLQTLVQDTASFALRGSKISCHFDFPNDLWLAEVDKGQFSQVIQNLVINANQAMPDGGTIEIHAENATIGNTDEDFQLNTDFRTTLKKNQDRTNSRDISENRPYLQAFSLLK